MPLRLRFTVDWLRCSRCVTTLRCGFALLYTVALRYDPLVIYVLRYSYHLLRSLRLRLPFYTLLIRFTLPHCICHVPRSFTTRLLIYGCHGCPRCLCPTPRCVPLPLRIRWFCLRAFPFTLPRTRLDSTFCYFIAFYGYVTPPTCLHADFALRLLIVLLRCWLQLRLVGYHNFTFGSTVPGLRLVVDLPTPVAFYTTFVGYHRRLLPLPTPHHRFYHHILRLRLLPPRCGCILRLPFTSWFVVVRWLRSFTLHYITFTDSRLLPHLLPPRLHLCLCIAAFVRSFPVTVDSRCSPRFVTHLRSPFGCCVWLVIFTHALPHVRIYVYVILRLVTLRCVTGWLLRFALPVVVTLPLPLHYLLVGCRCPRFYVAFCVGVYRFATRYVTLRYVRLCHAYILHAFTTDHHVRLLPLHILRCVTRYVVGWSAGCWFVTLPPFTWLFCGFCPRMRCCHLPCQLRLPHCSLHVTLPPTFLPHLYLLRYLLPRYRLRLIYVYGLFAVYVLRFTFTPRLRLPLPRTRCTFYRVCGCFVRCRSVARLRWLVGCTHAWLRWLIPHFVVDLRYVLPFAVLRCGYVAGYVDFCVTVAGAFDLRLRCHWLRLRLRCVVGYGWIYLR